ncbi:hypothetical protein H8D29_07475 [PVC group bacterium]|nr:hypothetical protein [PVC group bacterium]
MFECIVTCENENLGMFHPRNINHTIIRLLLLFSCFAIGLTGCEKSFEEPSGSFQAVDFEEPSGSFQAVGLVPCDSCVFFTQFYIENGMSVIEIDHELTCDVLQDGGIEVMMLYYGYGNCNYCNGNTEGKVVTELDSVNFVTTHEAGCRDEFSLFPLWKSTH